MWVENWSKDLRVDRQGLGHLFLQLNQVGRQNRANQDNQFHQVHLWDRRNPNNNA